MRISLFIVCILFTLNSVIGQVNWILEPTQESNEFVTPQLDSFPFIVVKYDDKTSKVVDPKGNIIVERDTLRYPLYGFRDDNLVLPVMKYNGKPRIYNTDHKLISEGYDKVNTQFGYHTLITTKKGLLGLIDLQGEVLIKNKYKLLKRIATGKFKAIKENDKKVILTIKDYPDPRRLGGCTLNGKTLYRVLENLCDYPFGILNNNGDTILHHQTYNTYFHYRCPKMLMDSFIYVKSHSTKKYGLINLEGELILDTIYTSIQPVTFVPSVQSYPFSFHVKTDTTSSIFDVRTKTISNYGYDHAYLSGSNIYVKKDGYKGILDLNGNLEIPPIYHYAVKRDSSYILTRNDSVFIYSIKKNAFAQDTFDDQLSNRSSIFVLKKNKKYCFYDGKNLKYISDTVYSKVIKYQNYYKCSYITRDTTYYDPPKEIKNRHGEVTRTYSSSTKQKNHYEYRDMMGKLVYGPINSSLKKLNDTYQKHHISGTDSIVFVNIHTFAVQKFLKTEVNNYKQGINYVKGVIESDSNHYILDHFLDSAIDAVPYELLSYDDRTEVYIYKSNNKYGLLTKDQILTAPKFESIELRTDYQYVMELDGKYGIMEVDHDRGW